MKRTLTMMLMVAMLTACNSDDILPKDRNKKYVPIELTRAQKEINGNVVKLAFNMLDYQVTPTTDKSLFLSPLSLSAALSMVANGADGATYDQMAALLGFEGKSVEEVNGYYDHIINALMRADRGVDFITANSVWVKPGFELLDSFENTVEDKFLAEVESVDMGSQKGIDRINQWCSANTNGKIPTILDKPDSALLLFLANALYFKGGWKMEFEKTETKDFHHANGTTSSKSSIVATRSMAYYADEKLKTVEIPYGNGAYVMDMILPHEDVTLEDAAAYLAEDGVWVKIINNFSSLEVDLQFPKFRIESDMVFNEMLQQMGMVDAFDSQAADFSKMTEGDLMISFVRQKTYIDVTEKGTEAAAVTGVGMEGSAGPPMDKYEFIADRPFFFLIRERSTGVILFVGLHA